MIKRYVGGFQLDMDLPITRPILVGSRSKPNSAFYIRDRGIENGELGLNLGVGNCHVTTKKNCKARWSLRLAAWSLRIFQFSTWTLLYGIIEKDDLPCHILNSRFPASGNPSIKFWIFNSIKHILNVYN